MEEIILATIKAKYGTIQNYCHAIAPGDNNFYKNFAKRIETNIKIIKKFEKKYLESLNLQIKLQ